MSFLLSKSIFPIDSDMDFLANSPMPNPAQIRLFARPARVSCKNTAILWLAALIVPVLFAATAQAQEEIADQTETPLFVPLIPGEPPVRPPVPAVTPAPAITPQPFQTPSGPSPVQPFFPAEIPAPAIQSRPVTLDYIETPRTGPRATPTPAPRRTPASTRPSQPAPSPQTKRTSTGTATRTTPRTTTDAQEAPRPGRTFTQSEIAKQAEIATRTRDPKIAETIGWSYYNRDDFSSASYWFEQAAEWNPQSSDAMYGLALSKMRAGELTSAENLAKANQANPKMETLLGDIYSRRATEAYELGRYKNSIKAFEQAKMYRPLSRNEQIVEAWAYRQSGQTMEAAAMFENLYRAKPDQASADGLYSSLTKLKEYERLNMIAAETRGPLEGVYEEAAEPQSYFKAGLFRAAYETEGEKVYPILKNITSPSLELGFGYRQKSGQAGESALTEVRAPYLEGRFYPSNRDEIVVAISRLTLNSGDLPPGANFGTPPIGGGVYLFEPNTEENDLFEFRIRYSHQDWITPYVEIGSTPVNGPIQARPVGKAGLIYRHLQGYVQAEFFSRSIRESMTSYVGSIDPYTGKTWGRVTETGLNASIFQSIATDWTIFLAGSIGQLSGENVPNNNRFAGTIAIAKELNLDGFEYFTLGPAFSYETYDNNQNYFTYGNGGYFSPSYLAQGVIGVNALTVEGEEWLVRGSASVGLQTNQQASAPYFPLNPDGRTYPGTSASTGVGLIELDGGILLSPNWMIGGTVAYTVTADYNEGWATIYVRYFFDRRNGLVRTDLSSGAGLFR